MPYDPRVGSFLSGDPFVQAPHNGQSFNRYSYVFNNPLTFVDPSGFTAECTEADGCSDETRWSWGGLSSFKNKGFQWRPWPHLQNPGTSDVMQAGILSGHSEDVFGFAAGRRGTLPARSTVEPDELRQLREKHPELVVAEWLIEIRSRPVTLWDRFWGIGREHGFLAYVSNSDPEAPLRIAYLHSIKTESGYYDFIPAPADGRYPEVPGYTLIVVEHTHPFPDCQGTLCLKPGGRIPFPSPGDGELAVRNPSAFFVVRRRERPHYYYFGPRSCAAVVCR